MTNKVNVSNIQKIVQDLMKSEAGSNQQAQMLGAYLQSLGAAYNQQLDQQKAQLLQMKIDQDRQRSRSISNTGSVLSNRFFPFTNVIRYSRRNLYAPTSSGTWSTDVVSENTVDLRHVTRLSFSLLDADGNDRSDIFASNEFRSTNLILAFFTDSIPPIDNLPTVRLLAPLDSFLRQNMNIHSDDLVVSSDISSSNQDIQIFLGYLGDPPISPDAKISVVDSLNDVEGTINNGDFALLTSGIENVYTRVSGAWVAKRWGLCFDSFQGSRETIVGRRPTSNIDATSNCFIDTETGEYWAKNASNLLLIYFGSLRGNQTDNTYGVQVGNGNPNELSIDPYNEANVNKYVNNIDNFLWLYANDRWEQTEELLYFRPTGLIRERVSFRSIPNSLVYNVANRSVSFEIANLLGNTRYFNDTSIDQDKDIYLGIPWLTGTAGIPSLVATSMGEMGADGIDGMDGTDGVSTGEVFIYRAFASEEVVQRPTGGSYSFSTGALTAPDGWSASFIEYDSDTQILYASTARPFGSGDTWEPSPESWSVPIQIFRDTSLNAIYIRSMSAPPRPPVTTSEVPIPSGWSDTIENATGEGLIWSSIGKRKTEGTANRPLVRWTWEVPFRSEGLPGSSSITLAGADAPTSDIGSDGDSYIQGTGRLWIKQNGEWGYTGFDLSGRDGSQTYGGDLPLDQAPDDQYGANEDRFYATDGRWWIRRNDVWLYQGDLSGQDGTPGSQIITGTGPPLASLGTTGWVYIQDTGVLWRRQATGWQTTGVDLTIYGANIQFGTLGDMENPNPLLGKSGDLFIAVDGRIWQKDDEGWVFRVDFLAGRRISVDRAGHSVVYESMDGGNTYNTTDDSTFVSIFTDGTGNEIARITLDAQLDTETGLVSFVNFETTGQPFTLLTNTGDDTAHAIRVYQHNNSQIQVRFEAVVNIFDTRPVIFTGLPFPKIGDYGRAGVITDDRSLTAQEYNGIVGSPNRYEEISLSYITQEYIDNFLAALTEDISVFRLDATTEHIRNVHLTADAIDRTFMIDRLPINPVVSLTSPIALKENLIYGGYKANSFFTGIDYRWSHYFDLTLTHDETQTDYSIRIEFGLLFSIIRP